MRRLLLFISITLLVVTASTGASSEETKAGPKACNYSGTIESLSGPPNRILVIKTEKGPLEFHYKHDGEKECRAWSELKIGDNINVICKENKGYIKVECIKATQDGSIK